MPPKDTTHKPSVHALGAANPELAWPFGCRGGGGGDIEDDRMTYPGALVGRCNGTRFSGRESAEIRLPRPASDPSVLSCLGFFSSQVESNSA